MENIDVTDIVKGIMKIAKTPAEAIGTCELIKLEIIKLASQSD